MVYLDACIVIYWVEEKADKIVLLRRAFANLGENSIAYSPLVQLECLIYPYRVGDQQLLVRYQEFFSCGICLPVSEPVFDQATRLRATYPSLKTPDALHLACAQYHQCSALWTNDDRLVEIGGQFAINIVHQSSKDGES